MPRGFRIGHVRAVRIAGESGTYSVFGQDAAFAEGVSGATLATLSGPTTGNVGEVATYTVTLDAAATQAYTVFWLRDGPTVETDTIAIGQTSASYVTTWDTAETVSIDFTITPSLTKSGAPISTVVVDPAYSEGWSIRSTGSGVVWSHRFETQSEIDSFFPTSEVAGKGYVGAALIPRVVTDPVTGTAMRMIALGAQLAADVLASGGAGPRSITITDATYWPDPAVYGSYYVMTVKPTPDQLNNLWLITAKSGTTLTATYVPSSGQPMSTSQRDWLAGDHIGGQTLQWSRLFSALKADSNGKGVDDINNPGLTLRSRYDQTNFPWGSQAFGYGWFGHPDYHTQFATWRPSDYGGSAIDSVLRSNLWDGTEFYIQWRVKVDDRFLDLNTIDPNSSDQTYARKVWSIESTMTVPQQLTAGYGPSNRFGIPTTVEPPFSLSAYASGGGLASRRITQNLDGSGSPQAGSQWETTYTQASFLPAGSAYEVMPGEWITYQLRVKPGLSWEPTGNPTAAGVRNTEIEVKIARENDTTYTTVLNVSNQAIVFGSSGPTENTWTTALPGYNAFRLWGYLNAELGSQVPKASYAIDFSEVIFSTEPIPVPGAEAAGDIKPLPVYQNSQTFQTTSFVTTLSGSFDVGDGPSTGVVARVLSHTGSIGDINSFTIGGVALTALAQVDLRSSFSAKEKVFYGVGLSLTGVQSWTVQVSAGSRIVVQLFAAHSVVAFDAGVDVSSTAIINRTLSRAVTPDANSIHVGMLWNYSTTGTLTGKSGTMLRHQVQTALGRSCVTTEDYQSDPSVDAVEAGDAFTSTWMGRIVRLQGKVNALPSYVPAAGACDVLTVANGRLANNFVSQCAPYFDVFYFPQVSGTYSGSQKNPYFGDYGCAWFCGGGHGNGNDNSAVLAVYGPTNVEFRRVIDPTPWFGTATDSATRAANSGAFANDVFNGTTVRAGMDIVSNSPVIFDYGLSLIDGKPGSSHTYGIGSFIGPEWGGSAHGTFLRVWSPALNRGWQEGCVSALAVDFTSTDTASTVPAWRKVNNARVYGPDINFGSAPGLTRFVGPQNREYIVTRGSKPLRWFDMTTQAYVTGTGTNFSVDNMNAPGGEASGGSLMYVPSRGLLVCAYQNGAGNVILQWMDVTANDPTLGGTATLSEPIAAATPHWCAATWVPEANRIVIGSLAGDTTHVYEVAIPTTLTSTWTATKVAVTGQALPALSGNSNFNRWDYDERLKAIFIMRRANSSGTPDTAYIYRPRNT